MDKKTLALLARSAFGETTHLEEEDVRKIIKSPLERLLYNDLLKENTKFSSYQEYEQSEAEREQKGLKKLRNRLSSVQQKSFNFRIAFNTLSKEVSSRVIEIAESLNSTLVEVFNTPNQTIIIPLSQVRSGSKRRKRIPNTSINFKGDFSLFKKILEQCFSIIEPQNRLIVEFEDEVQIILSSVDNIKENIHLEQQFKASKVFQIRINID